MTIFDNYKWGECRAADRIRSMVSGLAPEKAKRKGFMFAQAFFDESSDHLGEHSLVIGGYISTAEKWTEFAKEWSEAITNDKNIRPNNQGHRVFKSGSLKGKLSQKRIKKFQRFHRIAENHVVAGAYIIVDIAALNKIVDEFLPFPYVVDQVAFEKLARNPYFWGVKHLIRA